MGLYHPLLDRMCNFGSLNQGFSHFTATLTWNFFSFYVLQFLFFFVFNFRPQNLLFNSRSRVFFLGLVVKKISPKIDT